MSDPEPTPTDVSPPPSALSIDVRRDGDAANVKVRGEIDLETTAELSSALAGVQSATDVSIDLSDVTYLDSTGLRALLTARDAAAEAGARLRVSATSSIVARLIEITGVTELLDP